MYTPTQNPQFINNLFIALLFAYQFHMHFDLAISRIW